MSEHVCFICNGQRASIRETKGEIVHLLRIAERRPDTYQAKNSLDRVHELKTRVHRKTQMLTDHLKDFA